MKEKYKRVLEHNRKHEKLVKLREIMKDHKYGWVVRVFGSDMTEEQIDTYVAVYGENK